jgi:hypothetical protein
MLSIQRYSPAHGLRLAGVLPDYLATLIELDLADTVPGLADSIDRHEALVDAARQAPKAETATRDQLATDLATGAVTISKGSQQAHALSVRVSAAGAVVETLQLAATKALHQALASLTDLGDRLLTDVLDPEVQRIVKQARPLAPHVVGVETDEQALNGDERTREAWLDLGALLRRLETVQRLADDWRNHAGLLPEADSGTYANARPYELHTRKPWLLPTYNREQATRLHDARWLVDMLAAEPAELTWTEHETTQGERLEHYRDKAEAARLRSLPQNATAA